MTAPAIASSTLVASSRVALNAPSPASTAGFAQQLHAARQSSEPPAPKLAPAPEARSSAPGPSGAPEKPPAPTQTEARRADNRTDRSHTSADKAAARNDPKSNAHAGPATAADVPASPAATTTAQVAATADGSAGDAGSQEKDAGDDVQDASSLVGAMLALVGPAASKVLSAGLVDPSASSDKAGATGDGGDALPAAGDGTLLTAAMGAASAGIPAPWLAANNLAPGLKDDHHGAATDPTAALALPTSTLAAPAAPVAAPVQAPTGTQAFAQELGQQLTWFVSQGVQQARVHLHPEELGSLDLKISVDRGQVNVVFHTQHPGAVAAVQQSLPQLGQMLAQHGLSLGNTEVGQHDRGDQSGHAGRGDPIAEAGEAHEAGVAVPLARLGLVDAFA